MNNARARSALFSFARWIVKREILNREGTLLHYKREEITQATIELINAYLGVKAKEP